jgi:MFS family permease
VAAALLGVGSVVSALGVVFAILAFAIPSEGTVFALLIGGIAFGVGSILGGVGGFILSRVGAEQTRIDARIRVLEEQLAQPHPVNVRFSIPPRVVLARF